MMKFCSAILVLMFGLVHTRAQDGFCMVNGATTGGAGGTVVTVTNGTDFATQVGIAGSRIIQVQGVISIGTASPTANKTILGLGTNATLYGRLNISGVSNVIVQNLRITAPIDDGISIWDSHHVWVDHCTLYDTADGLCDMNHGTKPLYATVSWCKFHYVDQPEHRFTMIADGTYDSGTGVTNFGYYTLHHNWWSTNCDQRMAASSYARVHYYNNFFNCTNNSYSSNARNGTEINSENNYYAGTHDSMTVSSGTDGKIRSSGNIYSGCTGTIHPGTDSVFSPPYSYTLDATATVPTNVIANAGAPGPDTVSIPPKIWDGGGSDSRWNTANNWGLNETPKQADTLVFAGSTRLVTTNNYAANFEFFGLAFSNTAGAFVLNGATFDVGRTFTDDSTAVQTINANVDFSFGQDRQDTNRYFNVSSATGSLVINGNLAGNTNAYFNFYGITKQGPGLLTLNGTNTSMASWQLNGGLVLFQSLDTNQPGSLGSGTVLNFNGGGLRWAPGNAADISPRTATIQSGGATLDSGTNNILFASAIGNNGSGPLTKTGTGKITLNGNNNFSGATVVAQGTLALGSAGALPNSSLIILSNNAVLDVSGRSDGKLTLASGRSLSGNGTVLGSVTAASGATIVPGASVGTLVITNALVFQSGCTNIMQVDKSSNTNDLITGMTSVSYGGRLIVSNLAGTFAAGDSFKLFSAGAYSNSFTAITWPALTGNLYWTNKLALDGTIAVLSTVNTSPTNLVATVVGNALQLSWPGDHIGWRLEAQTNSLSMGLNTNWSNVSGADATNLMRFPFHPGQAAVFFRLAYP